MRIRKPAVSGAFYPDDEKVLKSMLDRFFKGAESYDYKILGGISPHAGYVYSGQTAAYFYKNLKKEEFKRVIILGPSHHFSFNFGCLDENEKWEFPFGYVELDVEFENRLRNSYVFKFDSSIHQPEHSIEVQIPFLHHVFGESLKIVPILIGNHERDILIEIAKVIKENTGNETLIVASSDFYHGYSYEECKKVNQISKEVLENKDSEKFYKSALKGEIMACGFSPIYILLKIFDSPSVNSKVLHMTTSADVTGDRTGYVVGYISCAFYE